MDDPYKLEIRNNFYGFVCQLRYLKEVFEYSEQYRTSRIGELRQKINEEKTYTEFVKKHGEKQWREYAAVELFYGFTILQSIFISAYSVYESQLIDICSILEKNVKSKFQISDISKVSSDVDRLRRYLHLVHNVQAATNNSELWIKLEEFRAVRNTIVHHNGRIPIGKKDSKPARRLIESYNLLIDKQSNQFYIHKQDFLYDFMVTVESFTSSLVKEIAPVPKFTPPNLNTE